MDALLLIYNVLLLVLYSIAMTFGGLYYRQTKKPLYLYVMTLFLFYVFDNLVIYLTEFISWFSTFYDNIFMDVPTFKTIIIVVTLFCTSRINTILLKEKISKVFDVSLVVLAVFLLFIPMMSDSAFKVWLYYLPSQIFTFSLGIYGWKVLHKYPDRFEKDFLSRYNKLMLWTIIFSVLIVIEDTIVIFNFDIYSDILVKINNRSISEDIMSIGYSLFAIMNLARFLEINSATSNPGNSENVIQPKDISRNSDPAQESSDIPERSDIAEQNSAPEQEADIYSKFYLFCKEYQLTTREQDILTLLLDNKNNQEISDVLLISVGTTKTHTHNIFQKIGITKRQQLLDYYSTYEPKNPKDTVAF